MEIESISKVNLVEGDVVVVSTEQILPKEAGLEFLLSLKNMFPNNECIWHDEGQIECSTYTHEILGKAKGKT